MDKRKIKQLIRDNNHLFAKYSIRKLGLFGSVVRNEQTRRSDVDVLVDFKKPTFRNFISLSRDLEQIFHRKVDLVTLKSLHRFIKANVLKEVEYIERR